MAARAKKKATKAVRKKAVRKPSAEESALVVLSNEDWQTAVQQHVGKGSAIVSGTGGAQYISTKGARFTYQEEQLESPLKVVLLDAVRENVYYKGAYDPDNTRPPSCFAIADTEADLAPPADLKTKEHPTCKGCWANEFGSADTGRGKACKNSVRLALQPAGVGASPADMLAIEPALLRLPVTSVKAFAKYLRKLEGGLKRAMFAAITAVGIEEDKKTQHRITFELLEAVNDGGLGAVIMAKRQEVQDDLRRLPDPPPEEDETKGKGKKVVRRKALGARKKGRRTKF